MFRDIELRFLERRRLFEPRPSCATEPHSRTRPRHAHDVGPLEIVTVDSLRPGLSNLNLVVKIVEATEVLNKKHPDGSSTTIVECVAGDATGTVIFLGEEQTGGGVQARRRAQGHERQDRHVHGHHASGGGEGLGEAHGGGAGAGRQLRVRPVRGGVRAHLGQLTCCRLSTLLVVCNVLHS